MAFGASLISPFLLPRSSRSRTAGDPAARFPIATGPKCLAMATPSTSEPPKLVTFLGKGGCGKTTAAVLAAQHYAAAGLNTCLVIHSQDQTADDLLDCKIGTTAVKCSNNLAAVRLETTKMLLEPLKFLKQADARLNLTQGVLKGVMGEELGVLPGMDSLFSLYKLERFLRFTGNVAPKDHHKDKLDIIVYDGISSDETLRMMGATSKARLYLKYLQSLAEKTDIGRLIGPSLIQLAGEVLNNLNVGGFTFEGKLSAEVWDNVERALERGASAFAKPQRFSCYLVMDLNYPASLSSALHYWGCAIQSGVQVSGAFGMTSSSYSEVLTEKVKNSFFPMPFAFMPRLKMGYPQDSTSVDLNIFSKNVHDLLSGSASQSSSLYSPVKFDKATKSVTLFMPGFDKSEIKLYQYRGGTELLVEAGDQRRVVQLPMNVQGKVSVAKFMDRSLIIKLQ